MKGMADNVADFSNWWMDWMTSASFYRAQSVRILRFRVLFADNTLFAWFVGVCKSFCLLSAAFVQAIILVIGVVGMVMGTIFYLILVTPTKIGRNEKA